MHQELYVLRHKNESSLFIISLLFSIVCWLFIVISIFWLIYALLISFFIVMGHLLFMAYVQWNGTKLSEDQLPELYTLVTDSCKKMWINKVPSIYVLWSDGMLNAFATKTFSRNYIIICSSLLEACEGQNERLQFVITHELSHIALKHLTYQFLLLPSHILPYIGNWYSRVREYSCDTIATYIVWSSEEARRWLAILSVGGKYSSSVSLDAFAKQVSDTTGFFGTVWQMRSTHPHLCRRVDYLWQVFKDGNDIDTVSKNITMIESPSRNILWVLLSPFFNVWIWILVVYMIIIFGIIATEDVGSELWLRGALWMPQASLSWSHTQPTPTWSCGNNSSFGSDGKCYCEEWYDWENIDDDSNMNCILSEK